MVAFFGLRISHKLYDLFMRTRLPKTQGRNVEVSAVSDRPWQCTAGIVSPVKFSFSSSEGTMQCATGWVSWGQIIYAWSGHLPFARWIFSARSEMKHAGACNLCIPCAFIRRLIVAMQSMQSWRSCSAALARLESPYSEKKYAVYPSLRVSASSLSPGMVCYISLLHLRPWYAA